MLGMPGMFPTNQIGSLPGQAQVQGLNRNQSGSTNNNIEQLIYNLSALNNQLGLAVAHARLLCQYNALKRSKNGQQSQIQMSRELAADEEIEVARQDDEEEGE